MRNTSEPDRGIIITMTDRRDWPFACGFNGRLHSACARERPAFRHWRAPSPDTRNMSQMFLFFTLIQLFDGRPGGRRACRLLLYHKTRASEHPAGSKVVQGLLSGGERPFLDWHGCDFASAGEPHQFVRLL